MKFQFLTIEDSQHHVPVFHTGPVEGHGGVGLQGEGSGKRRDQVEGLRQPLTGQLSGLDNGSETGLEGLRCWAGRDRGCDHRHREAFGGVSVQGVEGRVGTGLFQGDAFVLQHIDTWWSYGQGVKGEREREQLSLQIESLLIPAGKSWYTADIQSVCHTVATLKLDVATDKLKRVHYFHSHLFA